MDADPWAARLFASKRQHIIQSQNHQWGKILLLLFSSIYFSMKKMSKFHGFGYGNLNPKTVSQKWNFDSIFIFLCVFLMQVNPSAERLL